MANEMPVTRRLSEPTTAASTKPSTIVISTAATNVAVWGSQLGEKFCSAIPRPYAPAAKKSACPNESIPASPNNRW
ncbi:hypothetical protein EDD25_0814 [Cryobacterium psychrophilum]|nr:hypothetical protein EDD25_0814 [Cryobacterium psychrophilum]